MIEENRIYYTYIYYEEDTPIYVGFGKGNRIKQHLNKHKIKERGTYFYNKIDKMLKEGISPTYKKINENLTKEEAIQDEIRLIKLYGRKDNETGILYNLTDGGEGGHGSVYSEERRKRISEWSKGEKLSEKHIEILRKVNTGKKHSEETKKKMSKAQKGIKRKNSIESIPNYIKAAKLRCSNPEYIKKISISQRLSHKEMLIRCASIDENNNIVKIYNTIHEAADDVSGRTNRILDCIKGKINKHKKFKWVQYVD